MDGLQALGVFRRVAGAGLQVGIERLRHQDRSLTVRRHRHERPFEEFTARDVRDAVLTVLAGCAHEPDRRVADDALGHESADLLRPGRRGIHAAGLEHVAVIERDASPDRVVEVVEGVERDRLRQRLESPCLDDLAVTVDRRGRQDHLKLAVRVL